MPGTLYLVATPIGNLQDISLRAIEVLRSVDLIACEDTRHSRKLLNHFSITNKLVSYHEHNEDSRAAELIAKLTDGRSIAVISDAGTPGICDPAFRLVHGSIAAGIDIVSVPGPVAFVAGVVASGLATDSIFFGGFLPSKKGERRKRLAEISEIPATLVLYETPHRLAKSLIDCLEVLGDRPAAIARELTKLHEEFVRGQLSTLAARYAVEPVKGEIVIAIERQGSKPPVAPTLTIEARVRSLVEGGLDSKAALKQAAKDFGISKSEAYRRTQVKRKR